MEAYIKVVFCENQEEQEKRMKEYRETTLPNHLKPFTNRLNAQQKWLVGENVFIASAIASWRDNSSAHV